jgi:hypothetical protein
VPRKLRPGARSSGLPLVAALAFVAAFAIAGCGGRSAGGNGGETLWIWRDHDLRHVEAAAFFAVLDAELRPVEGEARVRIVADEEYVLFLNGARISSGRWFLDAPGDEVAVGAALRPGRNRIVVELRSSTGAGGLWFELVDDRGVLARSDGGWSVYRGEWRGLFRGGAMPPGERPLVLGRAPLGRWGAIDRFRRVPTFESVLALDEPVRAVAYRTWGGGEAWQPMPERRRRATSFGPLVEIDFGETRTGYLQLAYRDPEGEAPKAALVVFGDAPIGPPPLPANAVIRPIFGRNLFQDARVRRFRYVAVAGLPGLFGAELLSIRDEAYEALRTDRFDGPPRGVFGVTPPPRSSSPVEHEIWRELERSTGLVLRKDR